MCQSKAQNPMNIASLHVQLDDRINVGWMLDSSVHCWITLLAST